MSWPCPVEGRQGVSSSVDRDPQPLPLLLRNPRGPSTQPLLLVVHGREAGRIPDAIASFADELSALRQAPVSVQALTTPPLAFSQRQEALWMVPLLLLPGSHVRSDVPGLARRLRGDGHSLRRLPFLGAWLPLQALLRDLVQKEYLQGRQAVLVHHPLRAGLASRHLTTLRRRLAAALVPADHLHHYTPPHRSSALPLALAANRMSESLQHRLVCSSANGDSFGFDHVLPPLLEHSRCRANLLQLLTALP